MRYVLIIAITCVVELVIFAGGYFWVNAQVESKIALIEKIEARLEGFGGVRAEVEKLLREKADLEQRVALINQIDQTQFLAPAILDQLADAAPSEVWLSTLVVEGKSIKIEGYGMSNDDVSIFMESLKRAQLIEQVNLLSSQLELVSGVHVYAFKITCGLKIHLSPQSEAVHG